MFRGATSKIASGSTRQQERRGPRLVGVAQLLGGCSILLTSCAGPFNQVQPCLVNCAVTLTGNPATAPVPASETVRIERAK